MKKKWSDYLWIASLLYLFLGLFHILFAWLGLICFLVPLLLAVGKGERATVIITAAGDSSCSGWEIGFLHSEPVLDG